MAEARFAGITTAGLRRIADELDKGIMVYSPLDGTNTQDELSRLQAAQVLRFLAKQIDAPAEPVAYASSKPERINQLLSVRQYRACLPKNRVDFDIPLYAIRRAESSGGVDGNG